MVLANINIDVFRMINDLGKDYPFLNPIIIFLAEYMLYFLLLALVGYWFTRTNKNRMMVIQAVIATIIAEVLGKIAGQLYSHHQPFAELSNVSQLVAHEIDNSFPSDHSIVFFTVCMSIYLVRKKEGWIWMMIALGVAMSRVWVGVHYPGDVLTGALIGIISAIVIYWLVPKLAFIKQLLLQYEKIENRILPAKNKTENM